MGKVLSFVVVIVVALATPTVALPQTWDDVAVAQMREERRALLQARLERERAIATALYRERRLRREAGKLERARREAFESGLYGGGIYPSAVSPMPYGGYPTYGGMPERSRGTEITQNAIGATMLGGAVAGKKGALIAGGGYLAAEGIAAAIRRHSSNSSDVPEELVIRNTKNFVVRVFDGEIDGPGLVIQPGEAIPVGSAKVRWRAIADEPSGSGTDQWVEYRLDKDGKRGWKIGRKIGPI